MSHQPGSSQSNRPGDGHGGSQQHSSHDSGGHGGSYPKFLLMILTSGAVMYIVMYLNTYQLDHVAWSWTRFFVTMMSTATMAVIMLGLMWGMYKNTKVNAAIVAIAVVVPSSPG